MGRMQLWAVAVVGLVIGQGAGPAVAAVPPNMAGAGWIWPKANATGTYFFRKTFDVGGAGNVGRLYVCCDNTATVYVNGQRVGKAEPLLTLYPFDVTPHLREGKNAVALECTNPEGPGGVIAKLFVGSGEAHPTDGTWKMAVERPASEGWVSPEFDDSAWTSAPVIAPNGAAPWLGLGYNLTMPAGFPLFEVGGQERMGESLRHLYYLHYHSAHPLIPLWDEWMPMATLWPAEGAERMRRAWAGALASRPIGPDGYVHTLQHDGTAHAEGWPFPLWNQGGGIGWHFAGTGVGGYEPPKLTKPEEWTIAGGSGGAVSGKGWAIKFEGAGATAATGEFKLDAKLAPYLRLNWWAAGLEGANPYVEWATAERPEFSPDRRVYFTPAAGKGGSVDINAGETRTMVPTHRHAEWKGTITKLRLNFDNPSGAEVVIKSLHTAFDTRHSVNNLNFVRGCADYFAWTGDYAFLRSQMPRIRTAMRFVFSEFQTRQRKCIYTTWPGHEGRSGVVYVDGKKRIIPGNGVGSNYWDLLPFGGEDALATVYYYDTLLKLAGLEEAVARHPEWNVAGGADAYEPGDLRSHAGEVREYGTKRFWNAATGRFGTVDLDGQMHDYGFTFLNNEAIYYGFATDEQAKQVRAWIDGARAVEGDTSTGKDIYHWRFGPRSTTKRNVDYYFWAWSAPESIPWGYQVQDGGGVLGWSYHDLMAILRVDGPDAAAKRLGEVLAWFDEVQEAGGYRAYYSDRSRGSMQGGNVPGGLGLDREFFESILPPQVMLYGFMGVRPTPEGLVVEPKLPKSWPSLRITDVRYREHRLVLTATHDRVTIESDRPVDGLQVVPPSSQWRVSRAGKQVVLER